MSNEYPLKVNSWTILSENAFIKAMDKSAFLHHGTGIPKKIKSFWGVQDLRHGDEKQVVVKIASTSYRMKITCDQLERTRLFWNADFNSIIAVRFNELYDLYKSDNESDIKPEMRFTKLDSSTYNVEFIDTVESFVSISYAAEPIEDFEFKSKREGKVIYQYSKRYERNPKLRIDAIQIHGLACKACSFNFGNTYGNWGEGYIEVHHTKPLYVNEKEIDVDPKHDLIPVCSNCHAMIHRVRARVLSIEQIKALIAHN